MVPRDEARVFVHLEQQPWLNIASAVKTRFSEGNPSMCVYIHTVVQYVCTCTASISGFRLEIRFQETQLMGLSVLSCEMRVSPILVPTFFANKLAFPKMSLKLDCLSSSSLMQINFDQIGLFIESH